MEHLAVFERESAAGVLHCPSQKVEKDSCFSCAQLIGIRGRLPYRGRGLCRQSSGQLLSLFAQIHSKYDQFVLFEGVDVVAGVPAVLFPPYCVVVEKQGQELERER